MTPQPARRPKGRAPFLNPYRWAIAYGDGSFTVHDTLDDARSHWRECRHAHPGCKVTRVTVTPTPSRKKR